MLDTGVLVYNAQSPDEAALVSAARNFGYVFVVCAHKVFLFSCSSSIYVGKESIRHNFETTMQRLNR